MARFCPDCGTERAEDVCPVHDCPTLVRSDDDASDAPAALVGHTIGGRYRLGDIIGRGGFGTVYRASHVTTREDLVVKVLKPEYAKDPLQVQRFLNEGRAAVKLKNQHTVRVIDFAQADGGQLYIAMELLHGQELAKVIRDEGCLDPVRAVDIAVAVLKSLAEAHHLGLVHRDLKPENVFLCDVYGEPELVKLIDFGIAKSFESDEQDLTKTGFAVGTPKYMSPEQARAEVLDGRSDLYSLGVILYLALAGELPFHGASAMATVAMHLHSEPPPLAEKVSEPLPEGLADVVMRALAKDRNARFVDAEDMRAALETVLEHAGEAVAHQGRAKSAKQRGLDGGNPGQETAVLHAPSEPVSSRAHRQTARSLEEAAGLAPTMPVQRASDAFLPWNIDDSTGKVAASAARAVQEGRPEPPVVPRPVPAPQLRTVREKKSSRTGPVLLFVLMAAGAALAWWLLNRDPHEKASESVAELVRISKEKLSGLTALAAPGQGATNPSDATEPDQPSADAPKRKSKSSRSQRMNESALESAVTATQDGVRKCYEDMGDADRNFTRVSVDVRVNDRGVIRSADLRRNNGSGKLAACVEAAVEQAHLPAMLAADDPVTLTYDVPLPGEKQK